MIVLFCFGLVWFGWFFALNGLVIDLPRGAWQKIVIEAVPPFYVLSSPTAKFPS